MRAHERRMELPPRPTSAAEARRFVADALTPLAPETVEVGVLLTSELVTNAVRYAPGRITLRVCPRGGAVRVAVRDNDGHPVRPRAVGPEATSGRGLALVEQLATSWGVDLLADDGKEVWFELQAQ